MPTALTRLVTGVLIDNAKRKALAFAFFGIALLLWISAAAYGLGALKEWVRITYGATYPDLWIGLGLLAASLPFVIVGVWKQRQTSRPEALRAAAIIAAPGAVRLATSMAGPRLIAVGAVATVGLLLGRRLGKR